MTVIAFFQSLRGKLILTYITVTVLALLALELVVLGVMFAYSWQANSDTNRYLSDVVSTLPPQARVYLMPDEYDLAGLQAWLERTYEDGYASLQPQEPFDSLAAPIVKSQPMLVIAPDGKVLAAAPEEAKDIVGDVYQPPDDVDNSLELLANAVQLELDPQRISGLREDGTYWMAVAVQQNFREGPLAAIIIVTVEAPAGINRWWPVIFGVVPATGLLLLFAVVPFGALFGFVMSQGLTRRLSTLEKAADAWSAGDFSPQPEDRSKDEIGHLSRSLRRMAEDIQTLLHSQRELALMEERNRMARELHDTIKQEAFATIMQLRAAGNLLEHDAVLARKHLNEAETLIKASQQELELMIFELRPAALAGKGLADALCDYVGVWSQHTGISVEVEVHGERRLSDEIEHAFFRVAQETLSNVARHSKATKVNVSLGYERDMVRLRIVDNGHGFSATAVETGFGLQNMRDRMTGINGELIIRPAPGVGTLIEANAPVNGTRPQ